VARSLSFCSPCATLKCVGHLHLDKVIARRAMRIKLDSRCWLIATSTLLVLAVASSFCWAGPLLVMPLGDSNTVGTALAPGSYRTRLWQDFGSDPTRVKFLGSQESGPPELGNKLHEGHSGYTIDAAPVGFGGIIPNINGYLGGARTNPDVILLLIGTNDINLNYEVDQAPARLDTLISLISDLSSGLKPNADLIVANIPPIDDAHNEFKTGNDNSANLRAMAFNATIPGIVAAHRAQGERVHFVDINSKLMLSDIADGLHMTPAGYAKVADVFYAAIVSLPEPSCAILCWMAASIFTAKVRRRYRVDCGIRI
jgi:GDSL-like Lipase/Acylhydrolase family